MTARRRRRKEWQKEEEVLIWNCKSLNGAGGAQQLASTREPENHLHTKNQQPTSQNSAWSRQEEDSLDQRLVWGSSIRQECSQRRRESATKGETVRGEQNNQAICHGRAWAHNQERFPNNHLVAAATSNPPVPSLQPVAGGDKRNNNKEAKQSTVNKCFCLKIGITFWFRKEERESQMKLLLLITLYSLRRCSN